MFGNQGGRVAARVVVLEGTDAGLSVDISRVPLVVGTKADANLLLTDPNVAPAHLELVLCDTGVRVRDTEGGPGAWMASLRVHDVLVTKSSVLVVGKTTLSLEIVWAGELDVFSNRRGKSPSDVRLLEPSGQTVFDDLCHLPYREARARALERFERAYLPGVLARTGNVVLRAAKHAGVGRGSFHRMLGRIRPERVDAERSTGAPVA